ncbi:MAG: serine/threonine-protein kinase [Candidatus Eremiobacterota bacterium]
MSDSKEHINSEDLKNIESEEMPDINEDSSEEIIEHTEEGKRRVVRKKRPMIKDPGTRRVKYSTKRLSKDKLEEYLESRADGKKRKIIIKKIQKKESPSESVAVPETDVEIIETVDEVKEGGYIDLASDYALPSSEGGTAEEALPSDWKEKKIASYKKKPEDPPVLTPFEEGHVLSERYEIVEKIYEDINGVLYKIKDLKEEDERKQIKSIKEIQYIAGEGIPEEITVDALKRLERMTSFLKDVDHVNLSKIYDYFSLLEGKQVRFFTVMEYIEGNTLEEMLRVYVKEGTPIPVKTIFSIMEKICDALYYLHNKKPFPIGFGDLKPSNVMMALDGSIKFINYGIGSFFDTDKDGTIQSRGTLGYAAPEQRGVDFTNTKADIFALGVTVYYMLTGVDPEEHPYEFKPLRKHKRFVSEKVQRFVDRCVAIDPDDRPDIEAVQKLIKKMDLHELDLSSVLKKKEEEIKKQEEEAKEPEPPPPPAISQEKVEEIITDFKVRNPFIASFYGIVSIIILVLILSYCISAGSSYISNLPRKGNFLYLTSGSGKVISELNLRNNKFRDFMTLPQNAGPVAYSPKKQTLYCYSPSNSVLYEIDINKANILREKKLIHGISSIMMSPDESFIYAFNEDKRNIYFIRIEDFKEGRSPAKIDMSPSQVSISLSKDRLFITCEKDEGVIIFDTVNFIVRNILTFKGQKPVCVAGNKDKAFVCLSAKNKIAVIDLKSGNILKELPVNGEPECVLLNPKEPEKLYVLTGKPGSIIIFDIKYENIGNISVPQKFIGFDVNKSMFCNGKIYIMGENTYIKSSPLGIYNISSGNLTGINSNSVFNFMDFVDL